MKFSLLILSVLFTGQFCIKAQNKRLNSTNPNDSKENTVIPKNVTLREAHIGTAEIDLQMMNQYVKQSKETEEFYLEARTALSKQNWEESLKEVCEKFDKKTIGGPMLGTITENSVSIWMHLATTVPISVQLSSAKDSKVVKFTDKGNYRTAICEGLKPSTKYTYLIKDDANGEIFGKGSFSTAPTSQETKPFKIAFGSDFHKIGLHRPELMKQIVKRANVAMVLTGDLATDDRQNDISLIKTDYLLRDLSPSWQKFSANIPIYTTWDDHDYFDNDASGSSHNGKTIDVKALRKIWNEEWNNPEENIQKEGIYFQTKIGPVHLIMLDTRSCRLADKQGQLNSFLGITQMSWLKKQIKDSKSPYIIISSGTMWTDNISEGKDSWGKWDVNGREEIFNLIDQKNTAQVLLLSGDRHGARGFAIPRPDNKTIFEFEAGTLGGVVGPKAYESDVDNQLFGYVGLNTWAFGEFTFETVNDKRQVTFRLIDEKATELNTITICNGKIISSAKVEQSK